MDEFDPYGSLIIIAKKIFLIYLRRYKLPSSPVYQQGSTKNSENCQITNFDMVFQKKNISSLSEKVDFVESYRFL
jgi:hypothetical protein